jgi:hypothetical protein
MIKEDLIRGVVNISEGAYCAVSDFATSIMKKREAGDLNLSRTEINQLIVANAIKQHKAKLH